MIEHSAPDREVRSAAWLGRALQPLDGSRAWVRGTLLLVDLLSWAVGLLLATSLRFEVLVDRQLVDTAGLAVVILAAVALQVLFGLAVKLYQGGYRTGSFDEAVVIVGIGALIGISLFIVDLVPADRPVPLSVPFGGTTAAVLGMVVVRAVVRRLHEGSVRPRQGVRALVFGAGDGGAQLIRSMSGDVASPYVPVGLLDDDPGKRHLRINGVRVQGTGRDMVEAAARTGATVLVVAVPSGSAALYRHVAADARRAGLEVKVLPGIADLLAPSHISIRDIRDIDVTDLLGRHQIDTDVDAIAGYLRGKRVLVTGAGGSIGAELCRQLVRYAPAELLMLDRDESALHAVQLSLGGRALMDSNEAILADIRDQERLHEVFAERRPQVVFHAAALKHVPMLEQYPCEGFKTNVVGTANVAEACRRCGVERFVNISTDKAANPVNVLGRTKRLAEQLTAHYARAAGTFLSVRFGNVLGSRGSVLTSFTKQVADGGPVTVTHPEVTRYFMTIPEAVQLVIQAAAIGRDGEALVLDMGEPVRISDVARQLIQMSERHDVEIIYTGMRQGEKLHEELFGEGETDERPLHPLISHVAVPALAPERMRYVDVLTTPLASPSPAGSTASSGAAEPSSTARTGSVEAAVSGMADAADVAGVADIALDDVPSASPVSESAHVPLTVPHASPGPDSPDRPSW